MLLSYPMKHLIFLSCLTALCLTSCTKHKPLENNDSNAEYIIKGDKWGIYNKTYNRIATPAIYDSIRWHESPSGFIAYKGNEKFFLQKETYKDSMMAVQFHNIEKIDNHQGAWVTGWKLNTTNGHCYALDDGVVYSNVVGGVVANKTETIINGPYDDFYYLSRNLLAANVNGLWGVNRKDTGNNIISYKYKKLFYIKLIREYEDRWSSYNGIDTNYMLLVQNPNGNWGTIDWEGNPVPNELIIKQEWISRKLEDIDYIKRWPGEWHSGRVCLRKRYGNETVGGAIIQICLPPNTPEIELSELPGEEPKLSPNGYMGYQ